MIRNLITTTVIAGAVASCAAVIGVASASQAEVMTSAGAEDRLRAPRVTAPASDPSSGLELEVCRTQRDGAERQLDYAITNTSTDEVIVTGAPDAAQLVAGDHPGPGYPVTVGDTPFTKNLGRGSDVVLRPGETAYGEIAWTVSDAPQFAPHRLMLSFGGDGGAGADPRSLGVVDTFPDHRIGGYVATNLHPHPLP